MELLKIFQSHSALWNKYFYIFQNSSNKLKLKKKNDDLKLQIFQFLFIFRTIFIIAYLIFFFI